MIEPWKLKQKDRPESKKWAGNDRSMPGINAHKMLWIPTQDLTQKLRKFKLPAVVVTGTCWFLGVVQVGYKQPDKWGGHRFSPMDISTWMLILFQTKLMLCILQNFHCSPLHSSCDKLLGRTAFLHLFLLLRSLSIHNKYSIWTISRQWRWLFFC